MPLAAVTAESSASCSGDLEEKLSTQEQYPTARGGNISSSVTFLLAVLGGWALQSWPRGTTRLALSGQQFVTSDVVPPEVWIYGGQMDSTSEELPLQLRTRGRPPLSFFHGEAVLMAVRSPLTSSPHTRPPTRRVLCKESGGKGERPQPPAHIPRHRLTAPAASGTAELCEMSIGVMLTGSLAPVSLWLAFSSIRTLFIRWKSEGAIGR